MDPRTLSGLELLRLSVAGEIPRPSIAETMGMDMAEINEGEVIFMARPDRRHLNPMGGVHGGFYATVLDSVTGCAVHTMLSPGDTYGTVDLNVKMLRAASVDTTLRAVGRVVHVSRQLGVADGQILDEEGRLYAHATASCLIKRAGK
ncbi:PaaI family thioesterase [Ectothiorhodospiraceae bacterium WFHF3C12]|nr:PaaI family thioesterase [Ectothiorhodospiraceae bacterium WFHF3C12]